MQLCNFLDYREVKLVFKRYASLYFVAGVDIDDNELLVLEQIHLFVEVRGLVGRKGVSSLATGVPRAWLCLYARVCLFV